MPGRPIILKILPGLAIILILSACSQVEPAPLPTAAQPGLDPGGRQVPLSPTHTEVPPPTPSVTPAQTSTPRPATQIEPPVSNPTQEPSSTNEITARLSGIPIDEFFEASYRELLLRDPDRLFINGLADIYHPAQDQWSNRSVAYLKETAQLERLILELLKEYDRSSLSPDDQLSYDIYAWYLEDRIQGHEFMFHDMPVNPLTIWGAQNWLIDFMVNNLSIEDTQDASTYIKRLAGIDTWVEQLLEGLEFRSHAGVIPPAFILEASIQQINEHLGMQDDGRILPEATRLYTSFRRRVMQLSGLTPEDKQQWIKAARDEIELTFIPTFVALREYLVDQIAIAPDDGGAWTLPDGRAYYAHALHYETSTGMSADEIHTLGISELERIQGEIQIAASQLGYTQEELDHYLSVESPLLEGEALLAEIERLIDTAEAASRKHFGDYPGAGLIIQPEPFGSLAYYQPPAFDGSNPGKFFVNLARPLPQYLLPALTFHETLPGHHLQGALTRELEIPTFRRVVEFNAFVEGWALYAERLAWEMGLYEADPMSNIGRLQLEQMRALRLVVDTGVHARGWTLEQASARVEELTGSTIDQDYLTRFLVLPGQASSYTIGMLKILELRQRATDYLGDRFDLDEFHDLILGNGPMPLEILDQQVNSWIEEQQSGE